ncbi:AP2-associated protein kinase 1 isoform X2 [Ricinus communis]|uniref:AP2-associated protein kinase 1 isoform X2 n=1 Tax=Ricinus communis TaxID=3988 RepID=UPI00201B2E16|nr:AP2-associated protein kinase 1 isoform X2 [Ricinus communis]
MWRFKSFTQKEPVGLEGRYIDVGNLKIHVRNAIAEGGFSCVYLALDAMHASKQYALKHMICNDEESLELALKEINVMKSFQGHPNIVALCAHAILDKGRTKEALLVMEFCEKSLVSVLDSRGAGYFEEKQVLSIFRDACNAVFAMHSQSPPIAHRDLKAENLLLGPDGSWKLCDFGSTSINHKRFEKPEDMGIEEDNIRKYTTPAYRAPEMWDLLRRDRISEKVDIWALGCLLFRICYFKNAFDGESKLQILNGNYRIPDLPKYSMPVTDLIRDMLQASPDDRPDITQVWFRVNEQLPVNLQKSLPDGLPEMKSTSVHEVTSRPANRPPPMPNRSPPPPPSSGGVGGGGQLGAFWSSQHARDSFVEEKSKSKFDDESSYNPSRQDKSQSENHTLSKTYSPVKDENSQAHATRRIVHGKSHVSQDDSYKDFEINFIQKDIERGMERPKSSQAESTSLFQNEAFNNFVAEFDSTKLNSRVGNIKSAREEELESEIERLKDQLKQANMEKAEMTSKYEKLSAICRSQRQEIQELKQVVAARTPSPNKYQASPKTQPSTNTLQGESDWSIPSPDQKPWHAFADDSKPQQQPPSKGNSPQSVRTRNANQRKQAESESWGFGADSFTAAPAASTQTSRPINEGNSSQHFSGTKIMESQAATQPAGWAGF